MTLIGSIRQGKTPSIIEEVAKIEHVSVDYLKKHIAQGSIIIPLATKNYARRKALAIGKGVRTKVNVNIGSSPNVLNLEQERQKLQLSIEHQADTIMDLSIGKNAYSIRQMIFNESTICVGTVPIYDAISSNNVRDMHPDDIFDVIEAHAKAGVDFITVHCGVTKSIIKKLQKNPRVTGIVSRGGAIMAEWIIKNGKENPLFTEYDRLLDIAYRYDITLSLGDGLRPGCIDDATDWAQIKELKLLGELTKRAWEKGVQVMVEGPGHIPLNEIQKNIRLQKKYCNNAPFYVLGPLVTDIAPGYDHITAAIGGAVAALAGADFLCYVTPAEHLHLPDEQDLVDGLIASRIAAHAADIAKGIPSAKDWDSQMAKSRKKLDWDAQCKFSINPKVFKKRLLDIGQKKMGECTMCGEFCSMKRMNEITK